ncbi:hypothetical protein [Vibrio sp. AND4]|uniref:hypothetical protein n=1 Tax=Vibrio sp. AND4 TaxID=314289 RepID=UPI00015F3094|nr:hypothetical protein [Vibrio sp. AND4]EDP60711.1 hypothetical protein AND4_07324 [Vibrio sp. AND4]
MKYLIAMIIGLVLLALAACGGGDSSDGGSGNEDYSTPPVTVVKPDETPSTQDLVVPEGFDYSPVKSGTLSVDISSFSTQRAHLSLYKQFEEDSSGNYKASYSSKVASIPLQDGKADFEFNVSDSQGDLLAEIWFYDGTEPIKRVITAKDSNLIL